MERNTNAENIRELCRVLEEGGKKIADSALAFTKSSYKEKITL